MKDFLNRLKLLLFSLIVGDSIKTSYSKEEIFLIIKEKIAKYREYLAWSNSAVPIELEQEITLDTRLRDLFPETKLFVDIMFSFEADLGEIHHESWQTIRNLIDDFYENHQESSK